MAPSASAAPNASFLRLSAFGEVIAEQAELNNGEIITRLTPVMRKAVRERGSEVIDTLNWDVVGKVRFRSIVIHGERRDGD